MPKHGLTANDLAIIQRTLLPFAAELERVALFGSRAQGTHRPNSDIDLVLYGPLNETATARIFTLLNEAPLPVSVDVVAYPHIIHPPLKAHIDKVALPIFIGTELLPC